MNKQTMELTTVHIVFLRNAIRVTLRGLVKSISSSRHLVSHLDMASLSTGDKAFLIPRWREIM